MSIVKMNKLSVIGLESEKEAVMKSLQQMGVVELNDQTEKLQDPEWTALIRRDGDEDQVSRLESELAEVQTVLDAIARYDTEKKPLFAMRKPVTEAQYAELLGDGEEARREIAELYSLYELWNEEKSLENSIVSSQAALMPWMSYELPLELTETRSVRVICGVIPAVADAEALRKQVEEASEATSLTILGADAEQQYLSLLCMKAEEETVTDVLKSFGFTQTVFKDMKGTAAENMNRLAERLAEAKKKEEELEARFRVSPEVKGMIRAWFDHLQILRDRARGSEKLLRTKTAFYFDGWVPAENQDAVQKELEDLGCVCDITVPEKDEDTPVLMKNNSFVYPVQSITELYSLPNSHEVDPTPIFCLFYIIFYGMMFADIGYGLILAGACFFAVYHYKLEGMAYRLVKTLAYCGVSTAIWGVLFGGFFGDLISIEPLWLNPLDNAMFVLAFSCIFGTVHLFVGMGIKAYMQIRDGHFFDAVCDEFSWYVFIIGLALLLFGNSYVAQGSGTVGMYMAIIGGVWIVACEFIRGKGIGKLIGLWNLYGVTSYLADILSYSRLLALGLASAVIAQVFNMLARMVGSAGIVGMIFFVVILVVGHAVNFAINALGSFVHASRLQYVEFFGKFYEGGGVPFRPFERKTKYIKFVKEEK